MNTKKENILLWVPTAEFVQKYIITNAFHSLENHYCLWYLMDENTFAENSHMFLEKKCIVHEFNQKNYALRKLLISLFRFRAAPYTNSYFYQFYKPDGTLKRKFPLYEIFDHNIISTLVLKIVHRYIPIDFFQILSRKKIYALLTQWIENYIPLSKKLEMEIKTISPVFIIIPTATFSNKQIDIVRAGKRSGSKIVVLPIGWDNITTKLPLYIKPDLLLERGRQNAYYAKNIFELEDSEIGIIGVYTYESFFLFQNRTDLKEEKLGYLTKLKIPINKTVFLFAGAMRAFDEISFIELLEDAISNETLMNLHIIYRPHPSRWVPISKEDRFEFYFKSGKKILNHITLDEDFAEFVQSKMEVGRHPNSSIFNGLYNSIDAIISLPTSVMVEAALFGKPVLGVACDDGINYGYYSAPVMMKREYFKYFRTLDWYTQCDDKSTFISDVKRLMHLAKMPGIDSKIKRDMTYIIYHDDRSFSERLSDCIERC